MDKTPHASDRDESLAMQSSSAPSGVFQCTQPCKQLIALYATVERLEEMVYRIQGELRGVEMIVAKLENERG